MTAGTVAIKDMLVLVQTVMMKKIHKKVNNMNRLITEFKLDFTRLNGSQLLGILSTLPSHYYTFLEINIHLNGRYLDMFEMRWLMTRS